jgi:hypothetical protein
MGERMTGSHEVRGSIPLSSTREIKWMWEISLHEMTDLTTT